MKIRSKQTPYIDTVNELHKSNACVPFFWPKYKTFLAARDKANWQSWKHFERVKLKIQSFQCESERTAAAQNQKLIVTCLLHLAWRIFVPGIKLYLFKNTPIAFKTLRTPLKGSLMFTFSMKIFTQLVNYSM